MTREELDNLIKENGFFNFDDLVYLKYAYDDKDNEFNIEEFVYDIFINKGITCAVEITYAFDSPGYDCDVLSVSWINKDGTLSLETWLLELC